MSPLTGLAYVALSALHCLLPFPRSEGLFPERLALQRLLEHLSDFHVGGMAISLTNCA